MSSTKTTTETDLEPFPIFVDMTEVYNPKSQFVSPKPSSLLFASALNGISNTLTSVRRQIARGYYRYEVTLCLYMLEPWEKWVLNSVLLLLAGLLIAAFGVTLLKVTAMYSLGLRRPAVTATTTRVGKALMEGLLETGNALDLRPQGAIVAVGNATKLK